MISASLSYRRSFCVLFLTVGCFTVGLFPNLVRADGKIGLFFHGLCNSAGSCAAAEGRHALGSVTGSGFEIKSPRPLASGCYGSATDPSISQTLGQIRGKDVTLIAYSAGSCAMNQLVDAIARGNRQDLLRIKVMVSLEASPNAFGAAVRKVQEVNPSVVVRRYSGSDFSTDHAGIPGSARMATEMLRLMNATPSSVVVDIPPGLTTTERSPFLNPPMPPPTNTGLLGSLSSGLSPFASLLSSFAPQQSAQNSPYSPTALPAGLSAFNTAPAALAQTPPPVNIASTISTTNSAGLTGQTGTSHSSQTQSATNTNSNTQQNQNNSSTFAADQVAVTHTSSSPSQATSSPTSDLRTTLTNILLKVRDILLSLFNYLRG